RPCASVPAGGARAGPTGSRAGRPDRSRFSFARPVGGTDVYGRLEESGVDDRPLPSTPRLRLPGREPGRTAAPVNAVLHSLQHANMNASPGENIGYTGDA